MGYDKPNYTQIPNKLLDDHAPAMEEAELRVVLAVARATFGWHKERDVLSIARLMQLTGLSKQGVINGTKAAEARGVLLRTPFKNSYMCELVVHSADSQLSGQSTELTGDSQPSGQLDVHEVDTQKKGNKGKKLNARQLTLMPVVIAMCAVAKKDYNLPRVRRQASQLANGLVDAGYGAEDVFDFERLWYTRSFPGGKDNGREPSFVNIADNIGWVREGKSSPPSSVPSARPVTPAAPELTPEQRAALLRRMEEDK